MAEGPILFSRIAGAGRGSLVPIPNAGRDSSRDTRSCRLPAHLKNQFDRAASSIALNLHEGWGRATRPDRNRFFQIAFGSIRECQAIMRLEQDRFSDDQVQQLDRVAASAYRLLSPCSP